MEADHKRFKRKVDGLELEDNMKKLLSVLIVSLFLISLVSAGSEIILTGKKGETIWKGELF